MAHWADNQVILANGDKIAVVMVGLPARGKSFIARNLARYLRWVGLRTAVISLASLRKAMIGDKLMADFFDPDNKEMLDKRTVVADSALEMLIKEFEGGAQVGILDASNTIEARRQLITEALSARNIKIIFLECIYEHEEDLVQSHVKELRMTIPEYEDLSDDQAIDDFKRRVQFYKPNYKALADCHDQSPSFIQLINGGQRLVVNQIRGFLPTKMLYYLMNLKPCRKSIFLVQAGPTATDQLSTLQRIHRSTGGNLLHIWTDTTTNTATILDQKDVRQRASLCKLDEGTCEDLTEQEIKERYPEDYKHHCKRPYFHRYHKAESYHDLVVRLESIIMELEKETNNVLILAHISVIRCIYAYFVGSNPLKIPAINLNPLEVIRLEPKAYGCYETKFNCNRLDSLADLPATFRQYVDH